MGSVTIACSAIVVIGNFSPAIFARWEEYPATFMTTLSARMLPRGVRTPWMRPLERSNAVTSQFWMMSTPRSVAARA